MVELKIKINDFERRMIMDIKEKKDMGESIDDGSLATIGDIVLENL